VAVAAVLAAMEEVLRQLQYKAVAVVAAVFLLEAMPEKLEAAAVVALHRLLPTV
jgi:hypothetical protein